MSSKKNLFIKSGIPIPLVSHIHYDFDNATTYNGTGSTITDLQGNNNTTLYNSPTFNNVAPNSFQFNGTNQYGQSNNNLIAGQQISLSIWFKPTRSNFHETIITSQGPNPIVGFALQNRQGNSYWVNMGIWGVFGHLVSIPITTGSWVCVSFSYDNTTLKVYKNGVFVGSVVTTASYKFMSASRIQLGKGASHAGEFFLGNIGEVEIWNKAISANKIKLDFNNKKTKYGL